MWFQSKGFSFRGGIYSKHVAGLAFDVVAFDEAVKRFGDVVCSIKELGFCS